MEQKSYTKGYYDGVMDTLSRVSKWLDEDTVDSVREVLLK